MGSIYVNSSIVHVHIQFTWSILHLLKLVQGFVIFLLRFSSRNMFLIQPKSESPHLWAWSAPPTSSGCRPAGWRDAPLFRATRRPAMASTNDQTLSVSAGRNVSLRPRGISVPHRWGVRPLPNAWREASIAGKKKFPWDKIHLFQFRGL